jgi:hypothetical protein
MSMKSMTMMPPMSRSRSCRRHLLGRFAVVAKDGLLQVGRTDVLAGVDVDDGQGLGALDDQRATRGQPDLTVEGPVELFVDEVALEEGQILARAGR